MDSWIDVVIPFGIPLLCITLGIVVHLIDKKRRNL